MTKRDDGKVLEGESGAPALNVGVDMDDVITKCPEHFRVLSRAVKKAGGTFHVLTSRAPNRETVENTKRELKRLGIICETLHFLPTMSESDELCPHRELDWYQKYLWMKVAYCKKHQITVYYDDDELTVSLFKRFAARIQVFKMCF